MSRRRAVSSLALLTLLAACAPGAQRFCYSEELCVEPDGQKVLPDGRPLCELNGTCGDQRRGDGDTTPGKPDDDQVIDPVVGPECHCDVEAGVDSDGDCLSDADEDANGNDLVDPWVNLAGRAECFEPGDAPGETDPDDPDTDGDGIRDGCEGFSYGLSLAFHADSDCDGLPDGVEDRNLNGVYEPGQVTCDPSGQSCGRESRVVDPDSDRDGIDDGEEDADHDGEVDQFVDLNGNGCVDAGDTPGESDPLDFDSDDDGIPDPAEDLNQDGVRDPGETYAWHTDSDCDGLPDGKEDTSLDGQLNRHETDPLDPDTDQDGILDGLEDTNHDGAWTYDETDPLLPDTDGDNIPDGVEDGNRNGWREVFIDDNGDDCWQPGEFQGELDPRLPDTDGDGLPDGVEDSDHDGRCDIDADGFVETCGFAPDTDCDAIVDGAEDDDLDGIFTPGELDPRHPDTDRDGLRDGCHDASELPGCEDLNHDGIWDPNETNPRSVDTDNDDLTDGCEIYFADGPTDPTDPDSDGDGIGDGDEDGNHNCAHEPGVDNCEAPATCLETDPRVPNSPCDGDPLACARWQVCATGNLEGLSFAQSPRETQDYRLALEKERFDTGIACVDDDDCGTRERCLSYYCQREVPYLVAAVGRDEDDDGLSVEDPADEIVGHVFEAPDWLQADPVEYAEVVPRRVFGFVTAAPLETPLTGFMDDLPSAVQGSAVAGLVSVERTGNLTGQPAHDTLPSDLYPLSGTFGVDFAQSSFDLRVAAPQSAAAVRNALLTTFAADPSYTAGDGPPDLETRYHQRFTLFVSAVRREHQPNSDGGQGVLVLVVALTPDDRCGVEGSPDCGPLGQGSFKNRLYDDRVARLEDLTGGSALARFEADHGATCEQHDQNPAVVDLLWIVDDSLSMQQIIGQLQKAAREAEALLTANAPIVDFRVALTTTNPSPTSKTRCHDSCDQSCGNGGCFYCEPQLGCYKTCPSGCAPDCSDAGGVCDDSCTSDCLVPPEIDRAELDAAIATDAAGDYALPGGGGTFYFEDTLYLDCNGAAPGIDDCAAVPGFAPFYAGGQPFGPDSTPRHRLLDNAGFLGAGQGVDCPREPMSLANLAAACDPDDPDCCLRLVAACSDGPTVLASQMCDLIRAMGGLPDDDSAGSARPHSPPEHGSRSARRLIESMMPALPLDYAETCTSCLYDPTQHLRLRCRSTELGCQPCDPRVDPGCDPVPLLSIFLSDEEDAFFKDDCETQRGNADRAPLPSLCSGLDGDPETFESCDPCELRNSCSDDSQCLGPATCLNGRCTCDDCETAGRCDSDDQCAGDCRNGRCRCDDDTDCAGGTACVAGACRCDRRSYCEGAGFELAPPDGYDPDAVARYNGSFTVQWRDPRAPQCASTAPKPEPCDAACEAQWAADNLANIPAMLAGSCSADPCGDQPDAASCGAVTVDAGFGPEPLCAWLSNDTCAHRCQGYGLTAGRSESERRCDCAGQRADPSCAGEGDHLCEWVQGLVDGGNQHALACRPRYGINDCRACKRFLRHRDAVEGVSLDPFTGAPLVGFGEVGRVYAIGRDKGAQGFGGMSEQVPQDRCGGGVSTWGRGDGQAYRELAQATLGRTQDVCAGSYASFIGLVLADSAALSAPYPLSGAPIAATLKVGISRELEDGTFEYVEVPRSRTQGFFYSALTNSVAFKADPVDGICNPQLGPVTRTCDADGRLEEAEIQYAMDARGVPREGDIIFISYRYWQPVPCRELCTDEEICLRVICPETEELASCPNGEHSECPEFHACDAETSTCHLACGAGEPVETCVAVSCAECEIRDETTGLCEAIDNTCLCQPPGVQACTPGVPTSCPFGFTCDESCSCVRIPGCTEGFTGEGTLAACEAEKACCETWDQAAVGCPAIADEASCVGPCEWDPELGCGFPYPTCCGAQARPECMVAEESTEAALVCRPQCVCNPGCNYAAPHYEVCQPVVGTPYCECSSTPP